MDTGAEVSLIKRKIYDSLKYKPELQRKRLNLMGVDGSPLDIDGVARISFIIGGNSVVQDFYVTRSMTRNVILGRDWLLSNGVRLYFDQKSLRIKNAYVPLEEDVHISSVEKGTNGRLASLKINDSIVPLDDDLCISSLLRTTGKVKIKPQTAVQVPVKVGSNCRSREIEIYGLDRGFLSLNPGLLVCNAVAPRNERNRSMVIVVNTTGKCMVLRRGAVVARGEPITNQRVEDPRTSDPYPIPEINALQTGALDFKAPDEFQLLVKNLLGKNIDLFAKSDADLGRTDTVKMSIDTGDHHPIRKRPYRAPLNKRRIISQAVDEMLAAKVIERSVSPWSFPMVIVKKADGSNRPCVDYRSLNNITRKNSYPLPLIDDILAQLGQAKYFTTLDLKSGYWQVAMDEESKSKTAFACHRGLFQFNVMPFGLCNAPAIFQNLMAVVLQGLEDFTTAYLDDVIIWSTDAEQHQQHLQQVFDRLRHHGLKLKLKKCSFYQNRTNYLGFIISEQGIQPDPEKVKIIKALPQPRCVRDVRSFIGMTGYYRRFVPQYSQVAEPLTALTRKHARFKWTEECTAAFEKLKNYLSTVPLLAYPDPTKSYILYTDASQNAIGACLTQPCDDPPDNPNVRNEKPLFFLSHKLSDTQTRWSVVEKEAYAIYYALQKLDAYLHGASFIIRTDHKPLKYVLESPMQNKKIQLWAMCMTGYDCTVEYVAGTENSCADLLSRIDHSLLTDDSDTCTETGPDVSDKTYEIGILDSSNFRPKDHMDSTIEDKDLDIPDKEEAFPNLDLVVEQSQDQDLTRLKLRLKNATATKSEARHHLIIDDVVYYLSDPDGNPSLRLFVPTRLRLGVLKRHHDLGHYGVDRTYATIRQSYYWPNLYKELMEYTEKCIRCKERNLKRQRAELQDTGIPPFPWAKIAVDLSGPYPTSLSGNRYIVGFIDIYSGYPEAFPVKNKTAENVAHLIIEEIFPRYGCPLVLISDNGTENIAKEVQETLAYLNIIHIRSAFYHPESNAKIERFHRTLHNILSKRVQENPTTWDVYLNQALAAIRFTVSETSKFSPYFLVFNRDVVLPVDNILRPRRKYLGDEHHQIALELQHRSFLQLHKNLAKAKKRQAKYADKGAKPVEFQIGDAVYLRNHTPKGKLDRRWLPFYRIITQTSPVSFVIKHQLDGSTRKTHANDIRLANVDQWTVPSDNRPRTLRRAQYAEPPNTDDPSSGTSSEDEGPEALDDKFRDERTDSSDEDDIPLAELQKRIRHREERLADRPNELSDQLTLDPDDIETDETMHNDVEPLTDEQLRRDDIRSNSDDDMSIGEVKVKRPNSKSIKAKGLLKALYQFL